MPDKFFRPSLPYDADSLPNNNRYGVVADLNQSPGGDQLDGDCNYLIDKLNIVNARIDGVVLGDIPGANDPSNQNKLLTTSGEELFWTRIETQNLENGCVTEAKLQNSCVTTDKLDNGSVTSSKIREGAVNNSTMEDDKISFDKIKAENNAHFQQFFNAQDSNTLSGAKIQNNTLPATAIADNALSGVKITTNTLPANKIVNSSITNSQLAAIIQIPVGTVFDYAAPGAVPAGYIEGNGQLLNRITYALLFAKFGTFYGVGDGATTFGTPDLRGRSTSGVDPTSADPTGGRITTTVVLGGSGGLETHTLDVTQMPSHSHTYSTVNYNSYSSSSGASSLVTITPEQNTSSTGGGLPHNNMSPFMLIRKIIYAGV